MATSLLWLPDNAELGQPLPACIYLHRWGGYPHDAMAQTLGPQLAERGYGFLSLCLRRRGMEGQLSAMPDDDLRDIQVAVDFLYTNGWTDTFLLGEETGALSAARYTTLHKDMRVKGTVLLNPEPEPATWLSGAVGADAYQAAVREAGVAARQGAGMDYRIELSSVNGLRVTQQAGAFLGWWSPAADTRWQAALPASATRLALTTSGTDLSEPLKTLFAERKIVHESLLAEDLAARLDSWAEHCGARKFAPVDNELVNIESGESSLYGFLWHKRNQNIDTAVLLMHGLTSSPTSPLFGKLAPVLAQYGLGVLAIETHRSGWAGHESTLLDQDLEDIDSWIAFLVERGYRKIVLAGASMGSLSIGRYQAIKQNPVVAGLAHLMPTADCAKWFERAAGAGPYQEAVRLAQDAVAAGEGDTVLVDIDIRQPAPSPSRGRFRWTQRAASWLSWWGPSADSNNTEHFRKARVPLLLLSGTADSYNDEARFAEIRAAATAAPALEEIWYADVDHGLAGVERQVADDIAAWLMQIGVLGDS
jgi:alpha-beta hydrolase superfamily lysophospholipase